MSESRTFHAPDADIAGLARALSGWFQGQGYEVQIVGLPSADEEVIQARRGGWRTMLGLSTALTVQLRHRSENVIVEAGEGQWADKAALGTMSLFLLWPLAVTAGVGAWDQAHLPEHVFGFIESFLQERIARKSAKTAS